MTRFSKDHEWVHVEGDTATIGITDYAQNSLGDIVYVELPEVGRQLVAGKEAAVVESVKAASDVYAPVSGEVTAINDKLKNDPALINKAAQGDGWFFKVKLSDASEFEKLMDEEAYKKLTT
jgi:glycine cleavage system H protein